jgi:hypothetical protein
VKLPPLDLAQVHEHLQRDVAFLADEFLNVREEMSIGNGLKRHETTSWRWFDHAREEAHMP